MEKLWKDKNSKEKKQCKDRRCAFLQIVAKKPLKIQIEKYFGVIAPNFDEVNKEYEKYGITHNQLIQLLWLQEIRSEIVEKIESNAKSNEYPGVHIDEHLSSNKIEQYKSALDRNIDNHWFEKLKIRFYIITEWIMEDWAKKHNLDYYDYNETNPFSPQDCKIAGVDIDVKTTVSIGRYQGLPYFTRNNQSVQNEIQVAITSGISKSDDSYSYHCIQGIFDPSIYNNIDLELIHLPAISNLKNPCYFYPLENYFLSNIKYENLNFDEDVIKYWISEDETKYPVSEDESFNFNLAALFRPILDSPDLLKSYLESQLQDFHYDLIPIVLELLNKGSIYLIPHYFADYIFTKIINKERVDSENLVNVLYSLFWPNEDQRIYINNLFDLIDILPKVYCKWHPEESIKDMEIKFTDGHIPTFQAICSHDPQKKTTIYSYSWKTGKTLIYLKDDLCPTPDCGGLTHMHREFKSPKEKKYCRAFCDTYGRAAHNKADDDKFIPEDNLNEPF